MDDMAYEAARAAISEKDNAYFAAHGLADLLRSAGADAGRGSILALVRRLAADDPHAFLFPISAGLREAVSDDDEFARVASGVAATMDHMVYLRPVDEALVGMGRDSPAPAAGAAARMVGLGEAYFAAHIIGGAYGGAGRECDGLVERLFSSGKPRDAAAAVRALRIARAEHGSPDAGRIRDAIGRALAHDDEEVQEEAMEALVDLCRGGDAAAAEGMIESLVAGSRHTRPVLAAHIFADSPFDDEKSLRYLRACMGDRGDRSVLHITYRALAKMAGSSPGGVAWMLVWMHRVWHDNAWAEMVLDELGRKGAPGAVAAILEAMQMPRNSDLDENLVADMVRIAQHAGRGEVAGAVLRAIDGRPARPGPFLRILSLLAQEDWRDGGGPEFLEGMMSRLCARPAAAADGGEAGGGRIAERVPERVPERAEAPVLPA